jgi:hypothetical protein
MPDLGEIAFKVCYSDFMEHGVHIHGLKAYTASDAHVFLDLVNGRPLC